MLRVKDQPTIPGTALKPSNNFSPSNSFPAMIAVFVPNGNTRIPEAPGAVRLKISGVNRISPAPAGDRDGIERTGFSGNAFTASLACRMAVS